MSILREVVNILPIPYYYVLCREQQPFHIGEHTMNTNTKDRGRSKRRTTASSRSNKLRGIALALLLGFLLLVPQSARGGEIAIVGGYGLLDAPSPFAKVSLSFGKRVVFDFNGGVVFAQPDKIKFAVLTKTSPLDENIEGVEIPQASQLYSVGLEIRVLVRKFSKKHNAYLGVGADWLPQLGTYYPGAKAVTGYQISLLKKKKLILRVGTEYYLYGVVPVSSLALKTSLGYRF